MAASWEDDVGGDGHISGARGGDRRMHLQPDPHEGPPGFAVRIRGIPFQESEHTVHKWLQERGVVVRNGVLGIHFVYSTKRQWSGDAYASLNSQKDLDTALAQDQAQMNHRYLEIFPCSMFEMEDVLKRTGYYRLPNDYTIRLRGLEFKVIAEDIQIFFQGLDIASGLDGIYIIRNADGRTTGEAYVLFENKASVEAAVQKHKEKMGDRYIEIFLAGSADLRDALEGDGDGSRGRDIGGYGRGGQSHQKDEHFPRGGGATGPKHYSHPVRANEPRGDHYHGFYPPNDRQNNAADQPDSGPFRGGPSFAGYDHGFPNRSSRSREPGFRLFMRGLPWTCNESDIEKFFGQIQVQRVSKNVSESNVFDGSAWVEFADEDDMKAAKRLHKTNMGHRYVELFTEQEVEEKRLGTGGGGSSRGRSERGARSARGGREGAGPRGGGGARHTNTRDSARSYAGGGSVQSDYGRAGYAGPRTPYDRPLQYQPPTAPAMPGSVQGGYASYTSYRHQPTMPYGSNGNGGGAMGSYMADGTVGMFGMGNNGNNGAATNYGFTQFPTQPSIPAVGMLDQNAWNTNQPQFSMPYPGPPNPMGAMQPPNMQYPPYPPRN